MIKIQQVLRPITSKEVDTASNLIILVKSTEHFKTATFFPYVDTIKVRWQRLKKCDPSTQTLVCDLPNTRGTHTSVIRTTISASIFECLTLARKAINTHMAQHPNVIVINFVDIAPSLAQDYAEAFTAALLAANHPLANYKSQPSTFTNLKKIVIYGLSKKIDLKLTQATAAGNNLARELISQPANYLTPKRYLTEIRRLASVHHWKLEFLSIKRLQHKKAGAFLAVVQGSENSDAGIVHLQYRPKKISKSQRKKLSLVGKGLCYDTGGTNLKPPKSMFGMHEDMGGSAVALGSFLALTMLEVNFEIDCWLALADNMIGPAAYKQNDVVRACNGTTIEIVHTDAEGRMVLADTLTLASKTRPNLIIDYATLTGSCITALGTRYSGATTNRKALITDIIDAGQNSGERVWPFPCDNDYDEHLESQVADIKQCTLEGDADHILAARFLSRFVNECSWIHIDLSSSNHKGGLAHIPTDISGVGVRFTLNLLLKNDILKKL